MFEPGFSSRLKDIAVRKTTGREPLTPEFDDWNDATLLASFELKSAMTLFSSDCADAAWANI